ncbi:MAG: 3-phosphoshikimate 1-carboxyvinyltransferase [Candidatus Neomarinimicrobiota bacterium]
MPIKGEIEFPGDKSISHRLLMLASLAKGNSFIYNISSGQDVISTRHCLESCGILIIDKKDHLIVQGGGFKSPIKPLDCGNSGTTVRLLIGLLVGQGIEAEFYGDQSLSSRPMNRVLQPLRKMGAMIKSNNGKLPIKINKSKIKGIQYKSLIPSAQLKSATLLAGLGAKKNIRYIEPFKSRDHTENLLKFLGADIHVKDLDINLKSHKSLSLKNFNITVPGDPSTASFFATIAAIIPGSRITLKKILYNETRTGFFKLLKKIGVGIEWVSRWKESGEILGDLKVFYKNLNPININEKLIPSLIDEIPLVAVLATQAKGQSKVIGAEELRVKECDRIMAICYNLKNMGANVLEKDDGFFIKGPSELKSAYIKTFNDHRIAMAFSVAGAISKSKVELDKPSCVSVSYPEFFDTLYKLMT